MGDNELLHSILDAREERWQRRLHLAEQYGQALVTVTLCLPHSCRTHPDYTDLFPNLCGQVRELLRCGGAVSPEPTFMDGNDGPACFFPVEGDTAKVKRLCVQAEEQLPGGRMLDVDVMSPDGDPIGRGELGLPPRRCFVCEQPAAGCVSRRLHHPEEVLQRAGELLQEARG